MTSPLNYWIESTTGATWLKVPEMLPFETRMFAVSKTAGYIPNASFMSTLKFFDNFDRGNYTGWTVNAGDNQISKFTGTKGTFNYGDNTIGKREARNWLVYEADVASNSRVCNIAAGSVNTSITLVTPLEAQAVKVCAVHYIMKL